MARPRLPRDSEGNIIHDVDAVSVENVGAVVGGMTPEAIRALVESIIAGNAASQSQTADAIKSLIEEQGRTQLKSNAQAPGISVFSYPEGDTARPKPKLNMDTYFCGVRIREDELTPAEIELYNALNTSRTSRNETWTCTIQQVGTKTRRLIQVPVKTLDDRASLPSSLPLILMEFASGQDALDPSHLVNEVLKLRKQVEALVHAAA